MRIIINGIFFIINSLWTLHGLNAIDWLTVHRYMRHEHDWVAMTAAAVGEALPKNDHNAYQQQLMKMARSGYPRALQAAVSVAAIDGGHEISAARVADRPVLLRPFGRASG